MKIRLRSATGSDYPHLATMNARLIKDEGSRNPMSLSELEERFHRWSADGWELIVFETEEDAVGYTVVKTEPDEYERGTQTVYVRQFYIAPHYRGKGLGTQSFGTLIDEVFPTGARFEVDVLESNPRGAQFWSRVGFHPYFTRFARALD